MRITKADGNTASEKYLAHLCEKTFLSLWSYPSVYRDQRAGRPTEGKEICDLLVVFEGDVIVFSDKQCAYPESPNAMQNWSRWFRRAVRSGAEQVWGAERWLRSFPSRIFLDRSCTQRLPYEFPTKPRFHLIVVAHGAAAACKEQLGGSGSFMVQTDLRGFGAHSQPFTIGNLAPNKTFVHIFDDSSLSIVMRTLDTIADLVSYLRKKESLFSASTAVMAAGEEELLAWYLKYLNARGEHDFVFPEGYDAIAVEEGAWLDFQMNPQRRAQIEHDRVSYMWDSLIETFNFHALANTQYHVSEGGVRDSERVMRFFAREPRTRRRMLAGALHEMLRISKPNEARRRAMSPSRPGDPWFVFVLFPYDHAASHEENREARGAYLEACMMAVKVRWPDAQHIVGIATEAGLETRPRSEDAAYFDCTDWCSDMQTRAVALRDEFELFVSPNLKYESVKEYPTTRIDGSLVHAIPKNPRNKPCPCDSGKKYKHCHGR
jgi:hypothetical protein